MMIHLQKCPFPTTSSQAADMRALVWNSELEAVAQRWVDQCTFGHDSVIIIFLITNFDCFDDQNDDNVDDHDKPVD